MHTDLSASPRHPRAGVMNPQSSLHHRHTAGASALLTEVPEFVGHLAYLPIEDLSYTPIPCWTQGSVQFLLWKDSHDFCSGAPLPIWSSIPPPLDLVWGALTIFKGSVYLMFLPLLHLVLRVSFSLRAGRTLIPLVRGSFRAFLFDLGLSLENQKLRIWLMFSVVCGVIFFPTQPMLLVRWEIYERL